MRIPKGSWLVAALFTLASVPGRGDPYQTFCEVRHLEKLGQIIISSGRVDEKVLQGKQFQVEDAVLPGSTEVVKLDRSLRLGRFALRIELEIDPPVGRGYGGGLSTGRFAVYSNGVKKIDLPCGRRSQNDLTVAKVVLYEKDGFIDVDATKDGRVLEAPFKSLWLMDKTPITEAVLKAVETRSK